MKKFKEADLRQVAKNNAEYITPQALREFLKSKIEKDNITVLEPAIGSGQLLFDVFDKIFAIDGYDINQKSQNCSNANEWLNEIPKVITSWEQTIFTNHC
jgi:type I restriction-modification system DNA methylase subunit